MRLRVRFSIVAVLAVQVLLPRARAEEGMWLLNNPPKELLREGYGFEPQADWLEHLQRSCVRMGASGSLVSPDGLLLTNHHVGDTQIFKLSTPERDLIKTGFYARTREEELKCPDMEVQILWTVEDVTARVDEAAAGAATEVARYDARRKAMTRLEQESKDATGLDSEVVTLYHGARYHLYRYKRFTDIRLVMAPEKQIAFFGGDTDNFEYPRFNLDCCFFRIYEDGKPLKTEHYLRWSTTGAKDGELTFVLGHPGRTRRQLTADHLRFVRDVEMPEILNYLWRREVQLATFCGRSPEHAQMGLNEYLGFQNSRKARTGGYQGLLDPAVMAAKEKEEAALRAAAGKDGPDPWARISESLKAWQSFYDRYVTLREGRTFHSDLFGMARTLARLADELPKPSGERLREYRDSELDSVYLGLYSPAPIHELLEIEGMTSGLSLLAERFGADDPLVVKVLAGKAPPARAVELVRGCTLKDVEARKTLAKGGKAAISASRDPMIQLALALDGESRAVRKRFEDEIESVQRESYARIGALRFKAHGDKVYPDATGTLRMAFGPVRGFEDDTGRPVPPFTTFAGLYERYQAWEGRPPFDLPKRWLDGRDKLELSTPFNFIVAADSIGGNSGSPLVNRQGELVGILFDGNLQSLSRDFIYDGRQGRAVAVDARSIIEALRKLYDAGDLVNEILGGGRAAEGAGAGAAAESSLFDGKSLEGWKVLTQGVFASGGKVHVDDGAIVLERGSRQTGIAWTGDFPRDSYEVTFEARRVDGMDFFCGLTFPVGQEPCTLILGGWGGSVVGLSNVDGMHAAENETTEGMNFQAGRWYAVRLRVTPKKIEAWIDDEQQIDLERGTHRFSVWFEQEQCRPFGVSTWDTTGALRNIRLKRLS